MKLQFENIIPAFLAHNSSLESEVWGRDHNFQQGEKIIISAGSGKGKSTLLAYLFGMRNSYSGKVLFDDTDIQQYSLKEWSGLRRDKISLVFQELRLFEDMSVKENMELKLKHSPSHVFNDAMTMLSRLGVESFIDKPCRNLSFGQRQRVAIVRGLLQPFEWLLMDEPFSHLDDENATLCLQLINEVAEKNGAGYIITCLGPGQFPLTSTASFNRTLQL